MPTNEMFALVKTLSVILAPSNTVINAEKLIQDLLIALFKTMTASRNILIKIRRLLGNSKGTSKVWIWRHSAILARHAFSLKSV